LGYAAVDALMIYWFYGKGVYDFGDNSNPHAGEMFDIGNGISVPGSRMINASEAANYMAGYAGGYAMFQGANITFGVGVFAVGFGYGVADVGYATYNSGFTGLAAGFASYGTSLSMQYNGMVGGALDSLFDDQ
jgi:hypothetical protein